MRDPLQPQLDFEDEFVDWAFYQLPVWLVQALWEGYQSQKPKQIVYKIKPITDEEIKAMSTALGRLFKP